MSSRALVFPWSWTPSTRRSKRAAMAVDDRIVIERLSKAFGDFSALQDVSFEVQPGEVFGLLGPNGAGKTTLIRTLMGLLIASSGRARMLGLDCFEDRVALKRRIGYLPDAPFFYDYLTGWELIRFIADMHGIEASTAAERAERLFSELQLADAADDFVTSYSLGMKKKMALAMALLHEPSVLILDEPTTGLDPHSSRHIRQLIRSYAASGRTVMLSTHWLEMAEQVCDRVAILHHGRLLESGSPAEVRLRASATSSANPTLEDAFLQLTTPIEEQTGVTQ
jgi:ABC-2 type transport system ATP-binding protein